MLQTPVPPQGVGVKVETDRADNEVQAGESMVLKATLTNKGTAPLFRVYAVTKSDNHLFDNKELVIGRLDPGKSKTATAFLGRCEIEGRKIGSTAPLPKDAPRVCRIPRDTLTRSDGIKIHFEEAKNRAPADMELRATIRALERPVFAYTYQIADNRKGNGDGRVQKDEGMTMYLTVKNVGRGRSYETQANLRNLSGDGILLHDGRFDISNMNPGDTRKVAFTFDVQPALAEPEAKVELSIADADLREVVVEKVRMPIVASLPVQGASGAMRARGSGAELLAAPEVGAQVIGRLAAGASATQLGSVGDFVKLQLAPRRFAFARSKDVESGGSPQATVAFDETMAHAPPSIELGATVLATRDARTSIKGTASDSERLLDAFIFVGARKVFYRSNRNGSDPKRMPFESELPLRPGVNIVSVIARENPDTTTRKTFIVRRDGPNGELLSTPKTDDDLEAGASPLDD